MRELNFHISELIMGDFRSDNINNVVFNFHNSSVEYFAILNKMTGDMVTDMTAASKNSVNKWISNYNDMAESESFCDLLEGLICGDVICLNHYFEAFTSSKSDKKENEFVEDRIIQLKNIINMSFPYSIFSEKEMSLYQNEMLFAIVSSYKKFNRLPRLNIDETVEYIKGLAC